MKNRFKDWSQSNQLAELDLQSYDLIFNMLE